MDHLISGGDLSQTIMTLMIVFGRVGPLIMLMPGIGEYDVPIRIRLVFALILSFVIVPVSNIEPLALQTAENGVVTIIFAELAIGFLFGFALRMIVLTTQVAGTFIAFNIGLGFAQALESGQVVQGAIFASFLRMLALMIIFAGNLHYLMIKGLAHSYDLAPAGRMLALKDSLDLIVQTISMAFIGAVEISAPFIVFALVYNLGLGLLTRLMPQLQVFFVAMPVVILAGLGLFLLLLAGIISHYLSHATSVINFIFGG